MTVIGSAYVNIRAITDQLEADVRKAVESIKESITIKVDADTSSATEKLEAIAREQLDDQHITVDADTLPARRQFDDMLDDMDGSSPTIHPNVRGTAAEAQLAFLTRVRQIRIDIKANQAPLVAVGNALSRLSGARVATENIKGLAHEFANIDKAVPGIAKAALMVGSIGSSAISAVGGILTLGSSLISIVNMAGIVGPGMAAGFITGIATMMIALKDFSKQLPEVVAQYKTLATTIRSNFWDAARNPLREVSQKLFPDFQKGLGDTGAALGRWTGTVAESLGASLQLNGRLGNMFKSLTTSIDNARLGSGAMADSLAVLGEVGGAQLPRLGTWFTDVSLKFNTFVKEAAANGDLQFWVDQGIDRLKQLGSIIKNVSGIFNSITAAAKIAGSDGLATLLTFVTNLNNQLSQSDSINNMATIFQGANTAAAALGGGIGQILGAIGNAAPAIKSAFESVGGVVTLLADAISKIISNPEFQAGFTAMFDGIEKGFGALLPVVGEMGPKMGAFLSIIGSLAANIGGVLGAALEVVLPLITEVKKAIDPLIPVLGDALIQVIQSLKPAFDSLAAAMLFVAPAVTAVVSAVAPMIASLVSTLGPALPTIIAGVVGFAVAWKATMAVQAIINGIKAAILGYNTAMAAYRAGMTLATAIQAGFNISVLANPVVLIIAGIVAAIAALVAGVIWAYNNVGWFKDGVDAAFKFIGEVVANVVSFWNTNVVPMFEVALKAAGDFFSGIGTWIGEAITNVTNFFNGFGKGAEDAAAGFTGFFTDIGNGIADAFNGVVDFISNVVNTIVTVITTAVQIYINIWVTGFNIIRDTFVNIWNGLVSFFSPIVELLSAIISGVINIVVAIWQVGWEIVATIFVGVWTNLVRFFTPIVQTISDTISNVVSFITTAWTTAWQWISDFFVGIWNNIVAVVSPIIQSISDIITNVVTVIQTTWNTVWQGIVDFFTTVWNVMVAIYSPIIQSIMDTISTAVNAISATWNAVWGAISSFFSTTWSYIVAIVTTYVNGVMSTISGVLNTISSIWNSVWSSISSYVSSVWSGIVSSVSGFVNSVSSHISDVLNRMGRIGSDILNSIGNFPSLLYNAGADLIRGLANGITDLTSWVVDKVKGVGASVVDGLKSFFGIKSPSRLMRDQIGKQLGAGLALGIEQSVGLVSKAAGALAEAARPDIAAIEIPAVTSASAASQGPVLSRSSVTGTTASNGGTNAFGQPVGGVTNVNFTVNPSAGLNEEQIGESAMNSLYWKLSTQP